MTESMFCRSCHSRCDSRLICESCHEPGCKHCLKENEVGEKLCEECFDRDEKLVQCQQCLGYEKTRFSETKVLCSECRNDLNLIPIVRGDVKFLRDTLKDVLNDTDIEVIHGRAQAALNIFKESE